MTSTFLRGAVAMAAAPLLALSASAGERALAPDAHVRASNVAVVVFQDLPGSAAILSGNCAEGLDESRKALARTSKQRAMELSSNICAAQVKLGRLDAANEACESALAISVPIRSFWDPTQYRAVAHVNHGVVHFVQGDFEFALQEFRRAREMFPSLKVASSNGTLVQNMMREPHVIVGETL